MGIGCGHESPHGGTVCTATIAAFDEQQQRHDRGPLAIEGGTGRLQCILAPPIN